MAYAALISLEHTIEHLLNSYGIPHLPPCCRQIIQFAYKDVKSLQQLFTTLEVDINSKRNPGWSTLGQQGEGRDHYDDKVDQLPFEEDGSSRTDDDFDGNESKMVGLEDEVSGIKNLLINGLSSELKVVAIEGMVGIGKTALARQVYEHPSISTTFDCRIWVSIGSRILLTTRIHDVARYDALNHHVRKRFLNKKESWHLLCGKVFGEEEPCPPQLEEAGKKIADNCEGLPLAIIAVDKHLRKADKTSEYWKLAEEGIPAIFSADDVMSKKLMLSYKHLQQHLKACFLYLPVSKLIKMWCAEGFLERHKWDNKKTLL
ncbi:UNVERIFIED_CONTAM: putative late blight resistance proteinR1B-16 [Sesamum latifolium]|uniref:Late blight resistance proteinR1B-16 n=1 Tax=Sesamum latifolium TaxID=2727402 RepID=A0AAW2V2P4_9LAMI